MKLGSKKLGEN